MLELNKLKYDKEFKIWIVFAEADDWEFGESLNTLIAAANKGFQLIEEVSFKTCWYINLKRRRINDVY